MKVHLFYNSKTRTFADVKKLDDILAEVLPHYPMQYNGSKIKIQDYKKSDSTRLVREYIKDCLGFVKFILHPNQSEIISHTDPQAIYLFAIKGGNLFNPKEECFSGNTPAYVVAIDKSDIDINKCYADPEFDGMYQSLLKNYQGIPFIYDGQRLNCYQFNNPEKLNIGDTPVNFSGSNIELSGGALNQWKLHKKYDSIPSNIIIKEEDFMEKSSNMPSKYKIESEKFWQELLRLLDDCDKSIKPQILTSKGNTRLFFYANRKDKDYWKSVLSFIPDDNKDLSSFDGMGSPVVFIW